jgi:beta-lactamase regulating signal transducer with metallopeptidase domain
MGDALILATRFALDLAVKATLIFLATGVALVLLRRASAATRHLVGTLGLSAALLLPVLSLALPQVSVPLLPDVRPAAAAAGDLAMPAPATERRGISPRRPAPAVPEMAVDAPSEDLLAAPAAKAVSPAAIPAEAWRPSWPAIALGLWALGALASAGRLSMGWLRVRRITRDAEPVRDAEWLEQRAAAARRLDLSRPVELLESADVPVAVISGWLRPLLLIGRTARLWAVERRRVVLLHELAHVKRGDWPALLAAEAAAAFYWFHPAAWYLARQVRRDAETACDDLVIASGTKPSVYAGHLLGIFRALGSPRSPAAPALAMIRPHQFERRLRAILDPRAPRMDRPGSRVRLAAAGLLAAAACAIALVEPWAPASAEAAIGSTPEPLSAPVAPRADCASKEKAAGISPAVVPAEPSSEARPEPAPEASPDPEEGAAVPAIWTPAADPRPELSSGFVKASKHKSWKKSPKDGDDWYSKGMELHHDERYEDAIAAFRKSIDDGYKEGASSYNIACGYALSGNNDAAFEWLQKALDAGFEVSEYLGHDDDLDGLRSDPRYAQMRKEARERKSTREEDEVRTLAAQYERLAARAPKSGEPFFSIGLELLRADSYELAAKSYQQAIDRGYRVGTSHYNQACAYALAGDKDRAFAALRQSLDAGFDQPGTLARDDDLDNLHGDPRFSALKKEARELSLPAWNRWNWKEMSSSRGAWREEAKRYEAYAQQHPQMGRAWFNLGFASLAGDRPEAAAEAFRKALDLGYRKPTTMYNLACTYSRLDQKDAAFDWLFKSIDAGFDAAGMIRSDDDLDNLRGDPRYRKAIQVARAKDDTEN